MLSTPAPAAVRSRRRGPPHTAAPDRKRGCGRALSRGALLLGVLALSLLAPLGSSAAAAGRVTLPVSLPGYGSLDYIGLAGGDAVAENGSSILAVPLDGSSPRRIAAMPAIPDPGCTSGEGEDTVSDSWFAAGEGHLVSAGFWGCKLGDGSQGSMSVAGSFEGPFANTGLSCFDPSGSTWAVSSLYAVCSADSSPGTVDVSRIGSPGGVRTLSGLGRLDSLKLAGGFLATAASSVRSRYPATIAVTKLDRGRRQFRVRVHEYYGYAIGSDGTVVIGTGRRSATPCATFQRLTWYSPRSPRAHRLRYTACTRGMLIRGGKLIFQAPARGGLIAISQGHLRGGRAQTLAHYSPRGALIDGDMTNVLVTDVDCRGNRIVFAAPGGATPDPRSACAHG